MEFIWRPDFSNLGRRAELFTHIFHDFDLSPFDLIIEDQFVNGTNHTVDPEEWEYYWGDKSYDDWWWTDDQYEDITDDDWWIDDGSWEDDWSDNKDWWTED